jgi:NADPH:quinone reductase
MPVWRAWSSLASRSPSNLEHVLSQHFTPNMNKTMRALVRSTESSRMAVMEIPVPAPAPGQVLVQVKVSAVNEMDVQVRAGGWARCARKFLKQGPVVSGFEFAGIARSDGRRVRDGDRVIGYVHVLKGPRTHAEYVCVDENDIGVIPLAMPFDQAAALVVMGLTAIEILERLKPLGNGRRALIIGAAGGVGSYSLQLAKSQGAHVTAVCSSKNAGWVRSMGADQVRVYESEPTFRDGDRYDLVVDTPCKASFVESMNFMGRRGMYVCTNPPGDVKGFMRAALSLRSAGYLMMLTTTPAKLHRLIELFHAGALKPVVDSRYPLSAANEAFDKFGTSGKQGRVLLTMDG